MAGQNPPEERRVIAQNRKARHNYFIEETCEAGLVLLGSEVKSLRQGKANIQDAYADVRENALYLRNFYIGEYDGANQFNHAPLRPKKLLLRAAQIRKLIGLLKTKGATVVPLELYFNHRNIAKVELGLAKGKKQHDKRETIKQREWNRQKERILKHN